VSSHVFGAAAGLGPAIAFTVAAGYLLAALALALTLTALRLRRTAAA
jgi:hypothetical protein